MCSLNLSYLQRTRLDLISLQVHNSLVVYYHQIITLNLKCWCTQSR